MINRIFIILIIFILFFNFTMPVFANEINDVHLVKIGTADYHLKYYHEERGSSSYVICSIVGYYNNDIFFPTYCMNRDLPGAEKEEYNINVSKLLNNDAVWRVVTNGYPYVTANQMGLENDFDAYAVTKFAIYCVLGEANLEYYSYEPGDIVGQRMFDVLRYLVDLGINGKNTPETGTISMEKIGDLVECKNYYYQEYKVDSRINMNKYKIVNILDFPNNSYITNCSNNPQNVFKFGDNFRIFIPKEGFSSDINGKIIVKGEVKNYPIFYR